MYSLSNYGRQEEFVDNEEEKTFSVWINWNDRIVSFEEVVGFKKVDFLDNEIKLQFVVEKGFDGFRIQ